MEWQSITDDGILRLWYNGYGLKSLIKQVQSITGEKQIDVK